MITAVDFSKVRGRCTSCCVYLVMGAAALTCRFQQLLLPLRHADMGHMAH